MKSDRLASIPIPLGQRWRAARLRLFPMAVFGTAVVAVAWLWRANVASPTMIGQVEPVLANISSYKPGVITELNVRRFQKVKVGEPIGQVTIVAPGVLAASLEVLRAEMNLIRLDGGLGADGKVRLADFHLNWMVRRAELAAVRVQLIYAQAEFNRVSLLGVDKIANATELDVVKRDRDQLLTQVEQLSGVVETAERAWRELDPTTAAAETPSLKSALALAEQKLRLAEAELSPITLTATIDGTVTMLNCQPGEGVVAGQPIVVIAASQATRIIGYLRPPILEEPKIGDRVQVRARGGRREVASAQIMEVGAQMENLPLTMLGPIKLAGMELGLPVEISLPANLKIHPGELVDITLSPPTD